MGLFGYLGHFAPLLRARATGTSSAPGSSARSARSREIWAHRHRDEWHRRGPRRAPRARSARRRRRGHRRDARAARAARRGHDDPDPARALARSRRAGALRRSSSSRVAVVAALGRDGGAIALGVARRRSSSSTRSSRPSPTSAPTTRRRPTVLRLFDIHGVRAICMGHTHRPFARFSEKGRLRQQRLVVPGVPRSATARSPCSTARPFLWLTTDGERPLRRAPLVAGGRSDPRRMKAWAALLVASAALAGCGRSCSGDDRTPARPPRTGKTLPAVTLEGGYFVRGGKRFIPVGRALGAGEGRDGLALHVGRRRGRGRLRQDEGPRLQSRPLRHALGLVRAAARANTTPTRSSSSTT